MSALRLASSALFLLSLAADQTTSVEITDGSGNVLGTVGHPLVTMGGGAGLANVNVSQWGGVATGLGQAAMAASLPVAIASNQSALPASQSGAWSVGQSGAPWSQNITQVGGGALALGQAAMATSIPVAIASNQSTLNVAQTQTYTAGDGIATVQPGATSNTVIETFNGATYDRLYGTWQTTELASAARTIATPGSARTIFNSRSVQCVLNVTVASGTGGLMMTLQGQDSISANWFNLNNTPIPVVATGTYIYEIGPGLGANTGAITQRTAGMIPRIVRVNVTVGDASSYTYSVSCNWGP